MVMILSKPDDQYKLILTESEEHKTGIYVFHFKLTLNEETQQTFMSGLDRMIEHSIKDFPGGRIRIAPLHEITIARHKSWPIGKYDRIGEIFANKMERILNIEEELEIEDIVFEVIIIPNVKRY